VLILVGILLILAGLQAPLALVLGTSAQGTVTSVTQKIDSTSDPMDHDYQVSYRYVAGGRERSGSFTMTKVFNVATLPSAGSALEIRYIPWLPFVSTPVGRGSPGLSLLLLSGLGVLLLVVGIRGSATIRVGGRR